MENIIKYLSNDSKILVQFIKPFVSNSYIELPNKKYIDELMNKCSHSLSIDYSTNIKVTKQNTKLNNLNNLLFMSDEIKKYISNNIIHSYIIQLENGSLNIHMEKLYDGNINLFKLLFISHLLNNTNKKLKIDIFCTPLKKTLCHKSKMITKNNVNSGLTYDKKHLIVWRYEELYKVFIHELIHFYAYDFFDDGYIDDHLTKSYNTNSHINSCEAYTEFWAVIINCIVNSIYLGKKELFNIFLQYEISFSIFQTAKILLYFKFHSMDELLSDTDKKIYQDTNVFSYYIIKSALLFNITNVLKSFPNINFVESTTNFDIFKSIIDKSLHNKQFISKVNSMMDYINKNKLNKFISDTLRMTCIEL